MPGFHVTPLVRLTLIMSAIFLAFMGWIMMDLARNDSQSEEETDLEPTAGVTAPVEDFLAFADAAPARGTPPVGLEHEYTAEGILRLAAALEALDSASGNGRAEQFSGFRRQADILRLNPQSLEHADIVHKVFTSAAAIIGTMTGEDVAELRSAADAIDPDRVLLQQEDVVRRFFHTAANVIRDYARERRR